MAMVYSSQSSQTKYKLDSKFTHEELCKAEPLAEYQDIVEEYQIEPPFSSARILKERGTGMYSYVVVEPILGKETISFISNARNYFLASVNAFPENKEERIAVMRKSLEQFKVLSKSNIPDIELEKAFYYFYRELEGFGKIQVPLLDETIEDISCVGPNTPIYVVHRKFGSIATSMIFETEQDLDDFVRLIVQRSGKHISIAVPMVDCSLPDGSRIQATLGREVTKNGSTFTIRRFRNDPFTPIDLIKLGTMSADIAAYIWHALEVGQNIFIVGGTASGKTTTLNAILSFIPTDKKIVSIEDTKELNIPHENWVQTLTRQGTGDVNPATGKRIGEVSMFDLLVNSLRQRPDYIIVGEVRGREAYTVFQSMAVGHTAISTFHSNDIPSFIHRLEGEPLNIPRSMISSLNIILLQGIVKAGGRNARRIQKVVEVVGVEKQTNEVITNTVFDWDQNTDRFLYSGHSYLHDRVLRSENMTTEQLNSIMDRKKKVLEEIKDGARLDIYKFSDMINGLAYGSSPHAARPELGSGGE